jgi:hypothetical protein
MHNKINAAIIIPVYKKDMTRQEEVCFEQCIKLLKNHPIYLITPYGLDTTEYIKEYPLKIRQFHPEFFLGIKGYNKLLLSRLFYEQFIDFDYILIHQLDAFVFSDQLIEWCNKDYDYVGAPWINNNFTIFLHIVRKVSPLKSLKWLYKYGFRNTVGNGGLSLRKVSSFLSCFDTDKNFINIWKGNEDCFWSFFAQNKDKPFKIPIFSEAAKFAIENSPSDLIKMQNGALPFGTHAWGKNIEFWRYYFKKLGYNI